jgi:3-deoxy-manno-octulosonate cytidylyltransferase (CMP-KDO synthetase)
LPRIVGMIPARFASTRLPGKPLLDIHGKPMIQHVYERSKMASCLDRVVVATDDVRILEAVSGFGGESVLTRSDHASGTDRLAEAGDLCGLAPADIVVNIQGDEPLVYPRMIEVLVDALTEHPASPMATLGFCSQSEREYLDPNVVKVVVDGHWKALYFSRSAIPHHRDRAAKPMQFLKHLGFYAYRLAFLKEFTLLPPGLLEEAEKLEQLRALEHGHSIQVALSPVESMGIDTPEDLARLRKMME